MKRLIFCFDGTWNKIDAPNPTNVVLTAQSVLPYSEDGGIAQHVFYDEGVGTESWEKVRGGAFGKGLVKNLADGYRFLALNYSPGDEVFIFGFSRGAYTARTFIGLICTAGILERKHIKHIDEAIQLYKKRDKTNADKEEARHFRAKFSPRIVIDDDEYDWRVAHDAIVEGIEPVRFSVKYIGIWDTVGAMGIPAHLFGASVVNRRHNFHDASLSKNVDAARHALAIDERRKSFIATLWDNIPDRNNEVGFDGTPGEAPFQQVWFPGVHGSVGGGGERRGLSDQTLDWVLDGARAQGLDLDSSASSVIYDLQPNYREHLANSADQGWMTWAMNKFSAADRTPGPNADMGEVSVSTQRRWHAPKNELPEKKEYRPGTLDRVADLLNENPPASSNQASIAPANFTIHTVKKGDTLRKIAKKHLGDANKADEIFALNQDKIDHPDRIYVGQVLRVGS